MTSPSRPASVPWRPAAALGLASLLAACACAPCACGGESDAGVPGGAAPPGAEAKNLDEWFAYIAGEQITRRMIVRQLGERAEGQTEGEYERRIHEKLLQRVLVGCMAWRARQFGLELKPDVLDEQVAEAAKEEEEQAKERGIAMTFAQILSKRGQSLEEFKDLISRDLLVKNYWTILIRGVTGKRPQIDPEASPADCRGLYAAHRAAFDQQAGVRLVTFSARPESYLERAGDYAAAVEMAKTELRGLVAEVVAGGRIEQVAAAHGVKKGDYAVTPEGRFVERGAMSFAALEEWAFDPARVRGDVGVFDAPRGAVVAFGVLGVRAGRPRSYEEVLPILMTMIRDVRLQRFQLQHTLEVLASAPVKPPLLIDEVSSQMREQQKRLDADPVTRDIHLR